MAGRLGRFLTAPTDLAEQSAVLAAATVAGVSFQRGLMPRSTVDQAAITGLLVGTNYGLIVTSQAVVEAVVHALSGPDAEPRRFRATAWGVEAAVLAAGLVLQRALPEHPGEPLTRAGARSIGFRGMVGSLAGLTGLAVTEVVCAASRTQQRALPVAPLAIAGASATAVSYALARRQLQAAGEPDEHGMPVEADPGPVAVRSAAAGAGVAAATFVASYGERLLARGVAYPLTVALPHPVAKVVGHAVALGAAGAAGYLGLRKVFAQADQTGAAVEAAYSSRPTSSHVSGGPASQVDWQTIGREGRRYVNMALTTEEIKQVTGRRKVTDPVRVFVGLDSAPTPEARAELALRELEALGGLERPLIVFSTPTGTGYVNYVVLETIEYLTAGNCAQVAMQYSLRPSPMSLGRVGVGKEQNQAFLRALKARLDAMPAGRRPRVVQFGESLGAQTGADTLFEHPGQAAEFGVDRVFFIGMPGSTPAPRRWRVDPAGVDPHGLVVEIGTYEEWLALPEDQRARARVVLLSQHDDPIVKFTVPLAIQKPAWLGPDREPGIPPEMVWRPFATFLSTAFDAKNAMSVVPGTFVARGHDYRAQLARFVRDLYGLDDPPKGLEEVERALRRRELDWATRRLTAEQADAAESAIRQQLSAWGVPADKVPPVVAVPPHLEDPLAAE